MFSTKDSECCQKYREQNNTNKHSVSDAYKDKSIQDRECKYYIWICVGLE